MIIKDSLNKKDMKDTIPFQILNLGMFLECSCPNSVLKLFGIINFLYII